MFRNPEIHIEFDELIRPVDTIISMVYSRDIKNRLPDLFEKYKELSLIHQSSHKDLNDILKESVKQCLLLLSKQYLKKKLFKVLSQDGLIYYIYTQIHLLAIGGLTELIDNMPITQ
jgi:hypothetical protein